MTLGIMLDLVLISVNVALDMKLLSAEVSYWLEKLAFRPLWCQYGHYYGATEINKN